MKLVILKDELDYHDLTLNHSKIEVCTLQLLEEKYFEMVTDLHRFVHY